MYSAYEFVDCQLKISNSQKWAKMITGHPFRRVTSDELTFGGISDSIGVCIFLFFL